MDHDGLRLSNQYAHDIAFLRDGVRASTSTAPKALRLAICVDVATTTMPTLMASAQVCSANGSFGLDKQRRQPLHN